MSPSTTPADSPPLPAFERDSPDARPYWLVGEPDKLLAPSDNSFDLVTAGAEYASYFSILGAVIAVVHLGSRFHGAGWRTPCQVVSQVDDLVRRGMAVWL